MAGPETYPDDSGELTVLAAPDEQAEDGLQAGLDRLAVLVTADLSLRELLSEVAAAACSVIPAADGVGVTLMDPDPEQVGIESVVASNALVEQIDIVQYELVEEGPCITAAKEGHPVVSPLLAADPRWPRFGPRAGRLGVHSVLSVPLTLPGHGIAGAMSYFARAREAIDGRASEWAAVFAKPAAVTVYNFQLMDRARAQAAQLQQALDGRPIIEQAIGILRSRSGDSAEDSLARLRQLSQDGNVRVSVLAEQIVTEAVNRARARRGSRLSKPR
jgi:hypothetical protein